MSDFSLALNDEQQQIRDWTHGFAEDVMRPAAHEWDEREEFPYPIVEEAAKIGLYGWEFLMNAMQDRSGLTLPVAVEEIFWGDAGLGMAIMGSGLTAKAPNQRSHYHVPTVHEDKEDDFEGKGDDYRRQHHHSHGHKGGGNHHIEHEKR